MFFALPRVALGLCADLLASTLAAQGCGLRADMQLLNTVPGGTGGDLRLGTGWLSSCPLVLPGANAQSNPQGCSSSGSCTSIADYGTLRTFGSGNAVSCSAGGCFLKFSEWIGGEPKARFRDTLTVVAPGLAVGTPVQVRFSAQLGSSAPANSATASNCRSATDGAVGAGRPASARPARGAAVATIGPP